MRVKKPPAAAAEWPQTPNYSSGADGQAEASARPDYLEYVLGLTAFASGTADIISFTKLGGTLASAMTGNLAFIGLYLARGSFGAALGSVSALVGFVAGAAFATLLSHARNREQSIKILLWAEVFLLAGFSLMWFEFAHQPGSLHTDLLVTLLAMAMGIQSIIGKKIALSNIPTIVFTSTLTNIVIAVTTMFTTGDFHIQKDTSRQLASFSLYFAGALSAGFLVYLNANWVIALPAAAALAALAITVSYKR